MRGIRLVIFSDDIWRSQRSAEVGLGKSYEVVGRSLIVPAETQPKVVPVGVVHVDGASGMVSLRASDSQRNPVQVEDVGDGKYLVLGGGRVWVLVTEIDFEPKRFDQTDLVLDIGLVPDPGPRPGPTPPGPNPDVPAEAFDDLGRRIDAICDSLNLQIDLRQRVDKVYLDVAGPPWANPAVFYKSIQSLSPNQLTNVKA
ncbi:MAG: hypothetical protein KDB03_01545 [Planctomycetales bacterium]|nr:hypothetical protein [Planctomycetales bacterium]